jgi:transposase-like protein
MKGIVRYSEGFKRGVEEKVAQGKYRSLAEAGQKNGIRGSETVVTWIRRYGQEDILPKRVETMKETDELQAAWKEIKELKGALADAHIDWCLERAFQY